MPEFRTDSDTDLPSDVAVPDDFEFAHEELDAFYRGYVTSMLWANVTWGTDSGNAPEGYDSADVELTEDQRRELAGDVVDFMHGNADTLRRLVIIYRSARLAAWSAFGSCFALTRNGHGTGFWDRGWGDLGDELTKACKPYGEAHIEAWIEDGEIRTQVS